MEIAAEVTTERTNEDAAEVAPANANGAPLPTSTEAVAALALLCCYCGTIEGTRLSLVDRLDYAEDAVVKPAVANKTILLQHFQPKEQML